MCAFSYRGRRVAYDNIAVASVAGVERTLGSNGQTVTDPSLYNVDAVSPLGNVKERMGVAGQTIDNISNAALPGIEDTDNGTGDKLTSDAEDISDAG